MQRIGILGGTFNPIHLGHLVMAQEVFEKLKLDKIVFVPANCPPHKNSQNILPARDRCAMVRLAIRGNAAFVISDCEIKRAGKSYSIDTVECLRQQFPVGSKVFFIIGEDHLPTLPTWKNINQLCKFVSFVAVNRPGGGTRKKSTIKTKFISMPSLDISSSDIRKRIAKGQTVRYLLPYQVFEYIKKYKLYQSKG